MEDQTLNSLETLTTFLGWCTVINIGFLLFFLLLIGLFHDFFGQRSAKIFGVTEAEAKATFCRVFQQHRIAVLVLNFVPYIALKIMA